MRIVLIVVFLLSVISAIIGFFMLSITETTGHLFIGAGVVLLFFVWMPIFIYHRWKNRSVKDYMLSKENIEKMRNYTKENKI